MRLVEIIKSFGKFRRKRSTEKEVDKLADYQRNTSEAEDVRRGHENPALDVTITDGGSSAESSRSGSLDFSAVQLEQSTEDHLDHLEEEEDADDDRSSVSSSSVEDGTASTATTDPQISSPSSLPSSSSSSFVVRSRLLVSAWRRLKRVRAVGILCALASVLFWSFNGLLIKLNDGYFGVHVLESLTISSFIVCLVYLTFIFSVYGRRPANSGGLSSTSSVTSFASSTLSTSSSKKDIFVGGVSKGVHHHHHFPSTLDWRVILGVPGERWSLFLRCFLGTISLATFYTSYTYIPLSDATTIRFTSPVFIAAFAHFLVAEPFGLLQVVNSCTTLAGVVLIGRPSFLFGGPLKEDNSTTFDLNSNSTTTTSPTFFHFYAQFGGGSSEEGGGGGVQGESSSNSIGGGGRTHTAIGLALALISAVSISVSMIAMRRMKRTPAALVIFWFSACNVLLGLLGLAALGKWSVPPGVTSWAIIGSTTLCNGFDQLFVTLALKLENAGAVAVIQALCVVLSFLFSIAILQETLYWTSALGGAFIFLSVLMLGFAKMASEMAKSADVDKKKVPPKSDSNKGGGGRWRRRIFQLNLSTAAAKLKQSKSFDIISSSSSSHQQQKVGHLSSLGAFSNPTLSSTDSLSPNFTFAIAPPVYPLYQNTITSASSSSSATTESGLYGVGSEPYLLRVAPINGCEAQHRGLRPEQHNNNSIDGNNNVG